MKLSFFLALLSIAAIAQTGVSVHTTSTEALLSYSAAGTCTIEVSESSSYSPLVYDVNPALYTNADQDLSRSTTVRGDATLRTVHIGARKVKRDLAGIPRSLALQAGAVHYYRITGCGGTVTGSFSTAPVPFGLTYTDPIPADEINPGEVGWAALDYADRTKSYVDPHTGVLYKRVTGPGDIIDPVGNAQTTWTPWTNSTMKKAAAATWSGANFPYTVTGSTEGILAGQFGLYGWNTDPFRATRAETYASEQSGNINWMQLEVTAHTSQATCNSVVTDACRITVCLSTDSITCHPLSKQTDIALTTSQVATVVGSQSYVDQGGWVKPGNRWLNGVEVTGWNSTVTCDGSTTITPSYTPFNLAWGPGSVLNINGADYRIASVTNERSIVLTSSCPAGTFTTWGTNFGFLIKPKVSSANTITLDGVRGKWEFSTLVVWGAASYWDYASQTTVAGLGGALGYTFMTPGIGGVYWINGGTGNATNIAHDVNGTALGGGSIAPLFDPLNPKAWAALETGQQLTKYEYFGDFADRITGPTTGASFNSNNRAWCNSATAPTNKPCVAGTALLTGTTLGALAAAFDPAYNPAKFAHWSNAGINQDGRYILVAHRGEAQPVAWFVVYDPYVTTNAKPGNAGCVSAAVSDPARKGCIIAAWAPWKDGESRAQTHKGDPNPNVAPGWIRIYPYSWGGSADGRGPWQMNTTGGVSLATTTCGTAGVNDCPGELNTCPVNSYGITGKNCTQLVATSEPYDPTPGPSETGAAGEYITSRVGDWVFLGNVTGQQTTELGRIIAKSGSAPAITFTLARGQTRGKEACPMEPLDCGVGASGPLATSANPLLTYAVSGGLYYWNYANDPDGSQSKYFSFVGDGHGSGRFTQSVDYINPGNIAQCPGSIFSYGCYRIIYTTGTVAQMLATPATGVVDSNPLFAGQFVFGAVNNIQSHVSQPGHASSAREKQIIQDNRLFNGVYGSSAGAPNAVKVSGSLYKYDATANALNLKRKFYATKAQIGWRPMVDISSTATGNVIGTASADNFKYCVVAVVNECRTGSVVGEVYFNTPYLSTLYCANGGQASPAPDTTDVCIIDQGMIYDSLTQTDISVPFSQGHATRWLGHGFAASRMGAPFGPIQQLPNAKWTLFRARYLNGFRNEVMLLKNPSVTVDARTASRSNFIPFQVSVGAPKFAVNNAVVEFGYSELGSTAQLYCTSRAETCAVGRASSSTLVDATNPFWFAASEAASLAGTPCASGCTIAVPAISHRMLYYRIRYRDASNVTIALSPLQVAAIN